MTQETAGQGACSRGFKVLLIAVAAGWYVLLCAALFHGIRKADGGHFIFSLDDPYIHLALSQQIAHGHYGINAGEPASPSSSVLWPFLLAPFAKFASQPLFALLLNFLAGLGAAILAACIVASWPGYDGSREEQVRRLLSAAILVFAGNLAGLTFLGMEHTLQVMLAAACAMGIIACLRGRPIPMWCLVAAAIGPMVRYENVGLSLALAIALVGQGLRRRALVLMTCSVLPLMAFSAFLHNLGLPLLPTSVLVKGTMTGQSGGALQHLLAQLKDVAIHSLTERHRMLLSILFLTLAGITWNERLPARRFALGGATAAAGLHLLIGRFHWFHRYEVYIVFFSVLIILQVVHERPRMLLGWYVLGLLGCSYLYMEAVNETVRSSHEIYLEQYQMHRFATDFYTGNVAVNDLGLVSYQRRPGEQVLDLEGLGSVEAAREKNKSTAWLDAITRRHDVGLVMIYPWWFGPAPASWTTLGQLCLDAPPVAAGGACVTYYVTPLAPLAQTQQEFARFVKTLPPDVTVKPASPAAP
jgi:hypothetical protein